MNKSPDTTIANPPARNSLVVSNLVQKLPIIIVMIVAALALVFRFPFLLKELMFLSLVIAPFFRLRWYIFACLFLVMATWLRDEYSNFLINTVVLMSYIVSSMRISDMKFWEAEDDSQYQSLRPMTAGWVWIPISLIIAGGILIVVPLDQFSPAKYGLLPNALRSISILWLLAVVWFLANGVLNWAANRSRDVLRGRVYNRSEFCKQLGSELGAIEKRRGKLINKRARKRS